MDRAGVVGIVNYIEKYGGLGESLLTFVLVVVQLARGWMSSSSPARAAARWWNRNRAARVTALYDKQLV